MGMKEFESDKVIDNLFLGHAGDASYGPFREKHGITHICNMATEAQPTPNSEGMTVKEFPWHDPKNEAQANRIVDHGFKELLEATDFVNTSISGGNTVMINCV